MKNIILFLSILVCVGSCRNPEVASSLARLCEMENFETDGDGCSGDFIQKVFEIEADIKFFDEIGYYAEYVVDGTYDCVLLVKICEDIDYSNLLGSIILLSGDLNSYNGSFRSPIGGVKVYAINNITIQVK